MFTENHEIGVFDPPIVIPRLQRTAFGRPGIHSKRKAIMITNVYADDLES